MANADHYRRCYLSAQTMPPFTLVMKADSDSARQRSSFFFGLRSPHCFLSHNISACNSFILVSLFFLFL